VKRPLKFEKGKKKINSKRAERKKERKKEENEGLPRLGGNKYVN
jgi:hypothetical protein